VNGMSSRYALVDADGLVVNVVEWDGETQWSAPEDLTPVEAPDGASKSWTLTDGVWAPPVGDA